MRRDAYECDEGKRYVLAGPERALPDGWIVLAFGSEKNTDVEATICSRECAHLWVDARLDERETAQ